MSKKPVIFLGMPSGGPECHKQALLHMLAAAEHVDCLIAHSESSFALRNMNTLWCGALNSRETHGTTHMAVIHTDVVPDSRDWLLAMLGEMQRYNLDVLSAAVPLRNTSGLTSTAVETSDPWTFRNVSLKEMYERPPVWTSPNIVLNNGLMLVRLRGWAEQVCFRQPVRFEKVDGKWVTDVISEDWNFTQEVRRLGGAVAVTRSVGLYHGARWCHNRSPWGDAPETSNGPEIRQEQCADSGRGTGPEGHAGIDGRPFAGNGVQNSQPAAGR